MTGQQDWRANVAPTAGWFQPFVVLGVERCVPYWLANGLPPIVINRATAMLQIAREYLEQYAMRSPIDLGERTSSPTLVELAAASLRTEFGDDSADAVLAWGSRNFVLREPNYAAWKAVFISLATSIEGRAKWPLADRPRLSPDSSQVLESEVATRFGAERWRADVKQRKTCEGFALSHQEARLIAFEPGVVAPGDPVLEHPDLDAAETAMFEERTRGVWPDLRAHLNEGELNELLRWAKDAAPSIGIRRDFSMPLA